MAASSTNTTIRNTSIPSQYKASVRSRVLPAQCTPRENWALPLPLTVKSGQFHWSASWFMTLLTLAAVVLFVRLGFWQWHRAQQKTALEQQFAAGGQTVADLSSGATDAEPRYAQVSVHGRYDAQHQFVLDNISHAGQPGYEVLTPLQLDGGHTLLVNRGWVPLIGPRSHLPDVQFDASAPLAVTGRLDNLPVVGIALGHVPPVAGSSWPKLTSFPTMPDLSAALGAPLESRQLLLSPGEPFGFVRDWQLGGFGPGRHLSYAVQWWAFAALALGLYGYMNGRRPAR
jgi:surfeit locus 1 family protein